MRFATGGQAVEEPDMSSSSPTATKKPAKQENDADGASHTQAGGVALDGSAVANSYKLRGNRKARAHPAADVFPLLKKNEINLPSPRT